MRILSVAVSIALPMALSAQPAAGGPPEAPLQPITLAAKSAPLGKTLPGLREESFTVSPDGKRIAYVVGVGDKSPPTPLPAQPELPLAVIPGKVQVVVDGVPGPPVRVSVTVPVFSPDSQHVAYSAILGTITTVMVDGVESKPCRMRRMCLAIGRPVFSPDGRHLAYVSQRRAGMGGFVQMRMALDDSDEGDYEWIADPAFTPDSQRLAYFAWEEVSRKGQKKDGYFVNGSEKKPLHADAKGAPVFSLDGRRVAFRAKRADGFVAVLDGQEGPAYDWIGKLAFLPDGHLAYPARRGRVSFTVVEGAEPQEHPQYPHVGEPVPSPDGKHVAYWAYDGTHETVILDGAAGKPYDEIGTLVFSPDSRHLAVEARVGPQWRLLVDGVEGPEYMRTRTFPADRDSRHLLPRNGWAFQRADLLTYVGVHDGEMTRWEVQISETPPASH